MKKAVKFLNIFLLVFVLVTNNFYSLEVHSASGSVTVDIGETFGDTKHNVTIPVYIKDVPEEGVSSMNFAIQYDSDLMLNGVKAGELVSTSTDFAYSLKTNKVNLLFSDSSGGNKPIKNEGILCYLIFTINSSSKSSNYYIRKVTSENEVFADNSLKKLEVNFIDGRIDKKDTVHMVKSNKVWQVTFNQEIDYFNSNSSNIEVKDIKGNIVKAKFNIINYGRTLEIMPMSAEYEENNSYTITIKKSFTSTRGRNLSKETVINFNVEK